MVNTFWILVSSNAGIDIEKPKIQSILSLWAHGYSSIMWILTKSANYFNHFNHPETRLRENEQEVCDSPILAVPFYSW